MRTFHCFGCDDESVILIDVCQPLWRFTSAPPDGRLLIYRSEDIKNLSRLRQSSACGYVSSDPSHLLPDSVKSAMLEDQEEEGKSFSLDSANFDPS